MADIFISYTHADRVTAKRLADALTELGFTVWWDFQLNSGQQYRSVILEIIQSCKAAIVLWSTTSTKRDFVLDEAAHAKGLGKLMPARIDDCAFPFGFGQTHAEDLRGWTGQKDHAGFQALIRAVEARAPRQLPSQPSAAPGGRAPIVRPAQDDLEAFQAAIIAGSRRALQKYVADWPDGQFTAFVRSRLERVETPRPLELAPPKPVPPEPPPLTPPTRARRRFPAVTALLGGLALAVVAFFAAPQVLQAEFPGAGSTNSAAEPASPRVVVTPVEIEAAPASVPTPAPAPVDTPAPTPEVTPSPTAEAEVALPKPAPVDPHAKARAVLDGIGRNDWFVVRGAELLKRVRAKVTRPELEALAEADDIRAQFLAARGYHGRLEGFPLNVKEAVRLYRLAADKGQAQAQTNLGVLYEKGDGVARNYAEAARYYEMGARQGDAYAYKSLGNLYENGLGMERDHERAVELFRESARLGDPTAKKILRDMGED